MYQAVIAKVEQVQSHCNADKLEIVIVQSSSIVVGLGNYKVGDLVIYFPEQGQLSDAYCLQNDLYPRVDDAGTRIGGGFIDSKSRRVRAQKFRGEKSEGLVMPISSLVGLIDDSQINTLVYGTSFTELSGVVICNKYETQATRRARESNLSRLKTKVKTSIPQFHEHQDTNQFRHKYPNIPKGSIITITEKYEGTSHRLAHAEVITRKRLTLAQSLIRFFTSGWKYQTTIEEKVYNHVIGTRHTVLKTSTGGFYGNDSFRELAAADVTLHKGETLYSELVGYTTTGAFIQPTLATNKIKDKELRKQIKDLFGDNVTFKYGSVEGQCKEFVYHFTMSNEDGKLIHMPWDYTVQRCAELGKVPVKVLVDSFVFDGNHENLKKLVEDLTENNIVSAEDPSHLSEGIILHIQVNGTVYFLKSKNFVYKVLSDIIKEQDVVDTEEIS